MTQTERMKVAVIGSGNIGTDLMMKILRLSSTLEMAGLVGIDPQSDGLARAARLSVPTTDRGVEGILDLPDADQIQVVFDATSAQTHHQNAAFLTPRGIQLIDLTPAAIGPYVVPAVNLEEHLEAPNVNMVTCGGQATIPIVSAISAATPVRYAEIVASIASKSAGPGTRANIDEFTETTSRGLEVVGGALSGKAIIILNPAEPPMIMRDTVLCLTDDLDASARDTIRRSVESMVARVATYVPGYRLKQEVQFRHVDSDQPVQTLSSELRSTGLWQVSVFLEVEGAAHYLPSYAGNLDIMTSAALRVAERIAEHRAAKEVLR
jgi:acetaldehyde dehydrogenase